MDLLNDEHPTVKTELEPIERKPAIKHGWLRAILFLIAGMLGMALLTAIAVFVIVVSQGIDINEFALNSGDIIKEFGLTGKIVLTFAQFIGMFLVLWIFRRFIDRRSLMSLGLQFKGFGKDFGLGLLWGIVLTGSGFLILYFSGYITIVEINFSLSSLSGYLVLYIIVGFNEEIMVRGYMLTNLMDSMNKYIALFVSAAIFGVMHMGNPNTTVLGIFNILLAGLVLGVYYIHTGNLWFSIGIHITWNFFEGPIFGSAVSGGSGEFSVIVQEVQGSEWLTGGSFGFEGSIIATVLIILLIALIQRKYAVAT